MEGESYKCPGCGDAIPADRIDFKTRIGKCPSCRKDRYFPRRTLNSSTGVLAKLGSVVNFFKDKNFTSAYRAAETILMTAVDNAAALFVIAYCKAFTGEPRTRANLDKLFNETLPTLEFDEEELEALKELLIAGAPHLGDYEEQILSSMLANDPQGVAAFADAFSPYIVMKRSNVNWCTPKIWETYKGISAQGNMAKVWYALYVCIEKNPDSPYVNDNFFLKTKTQRFYDTYVEQVGQVFDSIQDDKMRAKFKGAFLNKKQDFINKMNEGGN
ncbi:MAG: hypothetical protein IKC37_05105 [Clostridia bacterium]|nr:hypothetical protein [Clostridia bacterium]